MINESIIKKITDVRGNVGFFCKNLNNGQAICHNPNLMIEAASIIKLFVMTEYFFQVHESKIDPNEKHTVSKSEKLPSCGAITYMSDNISLSFEDLCTLMIILSDNTATNILISKLGMEQINKRMADLGFHSTKLNRLLFDGEAASRGIKNYTSVLDCACLLEAIYNRELVDRASSEKMLHILSSQRLNGKIPFFLHSRTSAIVAHKTGEDSGITHDVGLIIDKVPFILCYMSSEIDVPVFERIIQDTAFEIWHELQNI